MPFPSGRFHNRGKSGHRALFETVTTREPAHQIETKVRREPFQKIETVTMREPRNRIETEIRREPFQKIETS
jgi:ribosome-associated toxin RatA of RatAB toxin-antitoxin module